MMSSKADFLSLAALLVLLAMALWFSLKGRSHFDEDSPRRPILFALEALSLVLSLGTIAVWIFAPRATPLQSAIALALAFSAGLLFTSALGATRNRNFGVVFGGTVPGAVIEVGPYRYIRHPLYTAYMLNWAGCAVLSGSLLIGAASVLIAVLYVMAARGEERDLLNSDLGATYAAYKRKTGLLLPRLQRG
jgi:protein-S-isoprenylcysteine O-methyltransferase Ste14